MTMREVPVTARRITARGEPRAQGCAARASIIGQMRMTWRAGVPAVLCAALLAAGCSSNSGGSGQVPRTLPTTGSFTLDPSLQQKLAAQYLAIARPANERLEDANDGFEDDQKDNLRAAVSDLRSETATERSFDQRLLQINFPPPIAAIAADIVRANNVRIKLTDLQARSRTLAQLRGFDSMHTAADAAVEVPVRAIRKALGLPSPSTS